VSPDTQVRRIRFRRAVTLMLMTLVIPGSAQLVAGPREVGRIAMRVWMGTIATVLFVGFLGLVSQSFALWFFTNTFILGLLRFALIGLALAWAYLFVNAWTLGDPLALQRQQRLAMAGINGLLCFSVAGALLFASHVVGVERGFLVSMFGGHTVTDAHDGRYNILLLGGDSGADRWGLRPDSINIASIDEDTGKTVLFGLPRNMLNFPFAEGSVMAKQFPNGYRCNSACFKDGHQVGLRELNSLVTYANGHRSLFKGYDDPGVEATKEAVEGITGLKINYYGMVNLAGFRDLVDAVGGVRLHVRQAIPIGGIGAPISGYVKAGYRKLNGFQTLWFARSRVAADDYSRMARQKCVMAAMLQQISPQKVVLNFAKIAHASEATFRTDLPRSEVDKFVALALKARGKPVRTVSFVPPQIATSNPDIAKIHTMVKNAIAASEKTGKHKHAKKGSTPSTTVVGGSLGDMQSGYSANDSADLSSSC
jgi:LCP family protein required for cell wall assembly